jgi:hypothetical protein
VKWVRSFVDDYCSRHRDPWCRLLHLVGVPLAPFLCLYLLFRGEFPAAGVAFTIGYGLQWLGHRIEGSEVGEWILSKSLWCRLTAKRRSEPAKMAR